MASSSATAPGQSAFKFLQRGAIIQEFTVAGQNIVLGFPDPKAYASHNSSYFGETIGRVANRVQDARLRKLNDRAYTLKANNGTSSLHGGLQGWGKKTWQGPTLGLRDGKESVTFQYQSIHGEEGYPGTVDARVNYAGSTRVEDGIEMTVLDVEYEVRMSENQPDGVDETVINVTNHRSVMTLSMTPPAYVYPVLLAAISTLATSQPLKGLVPRSSRIFIYH